MTPEQLEQLEFPIQVVDKTAYVKYLSLKEQLETASDRVFITSDLDLRVDLATTPAIMGKMIAHLPLIEIETIKKSATKFRSIIGQMAMAKKKAFGGSKATDEDPGSVLNLKKAEIIEYFGRFFKVSEVHRTITMEWGYDVSIETVRNFYKNHVEEIEELRKAYSESYSDVRLGYKRSRLDELSWIYGKTKNKYIESESREDAKLLQSLMESIKKEVEGDLVINGKIQIDIEQTIKLQTYQNYFKNFNINVLIVSRLAGMWGVNPVHILSRLSNSIYAKFTGFGAVGKDDNIYEDNIISPIEMPYNFNQIATQNADILTQEAQEKEIPIVLEGEKVLSLKEIILNKLKERKDHINAVKDEIELKETQRQDKL